MFDYNFIRDMSEYVKIFRTYPFPAILCDKELRVYWSNGMAKSLYPHFTDGDGLRAALSEFSVPELIDKVERLGSVTLTGAIPLSTILLLFTPILRVNEMVGAVLQIHSGEDGGAQAIYAASKVSQAFGGTIRHTVNSIFEEMDSLALKADFAGAGWIKPNLNRIGHDSYRILRLASNLADYANHQSGAVDPVFENVDVSGYFDHQGEALLAFSREIGIPLHVRRPPSPCMACLDRSLIESALVNLLHNAFYYTRPGNEITLTIGADDDSVVFTVADRGIGIPEALLDKVWQPYFTASGEGGGLGLTLVRAIVRLHQGSVSLSSTPGEGTSVAITLPRFARYGSAPLGRGDDDLDVRDRFSRLYTGLADAMGSPYREENLE